jgi:hypothetical protein
VIVAAIGGTAVVGWIFVGAGVVLFIIGAIISIVVALRTPPPAETMGDKIPIAPVIGWIFKYGGAGAPVMAVGFVLAAVGMTILGYEIFTWPTS